MRTTNKEINVDSDRLQTAQSAQDEVKGIESNIISIMSNPNKTLEDWDQVRELVEKARAFEITRVNNEKKAANFMASVEKGASYQEILKVAIENLKSSLSAIVALNLGNERRIDGININNRHFEQIDQISEIDEWQKQDLKSLLASYIKTKVSSYKKLEEFASKVLGAYDKRSLTEFTFDNEDQLWQVPMSVITWLTNSFDEDIQKLLTPGMIPIASEAVGMDIKVFEQYNLYLETGNFDRDFIYGAVTDTAIKNSSTTNAMVRLYNCKAVQIDEEPPFGR